MSSEPRISVVICTHNRARYLKKALEGLRTQTLLSDQYEVLVVDNRSTDETRELVMRAQKDLPNLQYRFEDEPGLSAARNRGVREACGEYIAFLDDDAIPGPQWLQAALDTFDSDDQTLGIVGGKVIPIWERERPKWLSDELLPYLTVVDLGELACELENFGNIVGTNMILPKRVLNETAGFPTNLGRKGNNLLSNEELALYRELQEAGYRAVYNPDANVWHHVHGERMEKRWLYRRLFWQGRSDAVWRKLRERPGAFKSLMCIARAAALTVSVGWQAIGRPGTSAAERFHCRARVFQNLGELTGYLRGK